MDDIDVLADIGVTEYHPDAPEPLRTSGSLASWFYPSADLSAFFGLDDRTLPDGVACRSLRRGPDGVWREVRRFNTLAFETVVRSKPGHQDRNVRVANKAVVDSEAA